MVTVSFMKIFIMIQGDHRHIFRLNASMYRDVFRSLSTDRFVCACSIELRQIHLHLEGPDSVVIRQGSLTIGTDLKGKTITMVTCEGGSLA